MLVWTNLCCETAELCSGQKNVHLPHTHNIHFSPQTWSWCSQHKFVSPNIKLMLPAWNVCLWEQIYAVRQPNYVLGPQLPLLPTHPQHTFASPSMNLMLSASNLCLWEQIYAVRQPNYALGTHNAMWDKCMLWDCRIMFRPPKSPFCPPTHSINLLPQTWIWCSQPQIDACGNKFMLWGSRIMLWVPNCSFCPTHSMNLPPQA